MDNELTGWAEHEDFENGAEDLERAAMAREALADWAAEAAFDAMDAEEEAREEGLPEDPPAESEPPDHPEDEGKDLWF